MQEQIIQAIKDMGENPEEFYIEENADLKKYTSRKFESSKYSSRKYDSRSPNISIEYLPTKIIEIFGGGGHQVNEFIEAWKSGYFRQNDV
jgi:hypothetical protein